MMATAVSVGLTSLMMRKMDETELKLAVAGASTGMQGRARSSRRMGAGSSLTKSLQCWMFWKRPSRNCEEGDGAQ